MGVSINTQPVVSIIMPAYNAQETIMDSIKSVQKQGYTNWELIVIDDHSDDQTKEVVEYLSKTDPRIKYIKNKGQYVSAARNTGIEFSKGKYLTFLDADDIYYKNAIEVRLNYLIKHKSRNAVFCKTEMTNDKFEPLSWQIGAASNVTFKSMHTCPFHGNSVMIRKNALGGIYFPTSFRNGEDWLFWQRLARTGLVFYKIKGCYSTYRQHSQSTVKKDFAKHGQALEKVLEIIYRPDPECPNPDPRYQKGLRTPPFQQVLLKRRFSRFVMCFLERNLKGAEELAETFDPQHWLKVSEMELYNIVRTSCCRHFVCHIQEWKRYWQQHENDFTTLMDKCFPPNRYPHMTSKLINIIDNIADNKMLQVKYFLKRLTLKLYHFIKKMSNSRE